MKGIFLVKLVTVAVALYEVAHPLSGKPIDIWDILATVITDMISYFLFRYIFKHRSKTAATSNHES